MAQRNGNGAHRAGERLDGMMDNQGYSYEDRAMMRKQRAVMRAAHMDRLRDDAAARSKPRASDKIPAKWYPANGPRVAGLALHGMIYAGANVNAGMLERPHVPVVSLVSPTLGVHIPAPGEHVPILQHDVTYASMSNAQRGKFLQFLASDMTSADTDDIGYVFLYLYGLERRLVVDVDAGGVSVEERRRICDEILRLDREFRGLSESFHEYAAALILYDGSIVGDLFARHDKDTDAIIDMKPMLRGNVTACCRSQHIARLLAYDYMLLSRMVNCHVTIPLVNVAAYAVLSMLYGMRNPNDAQEVLAGSSVLDLVVLASRRMKRARILSAQAIERNMGIRMPRAHVRNIRYMTACSRLANQIAFFGTPDARFGDGWMHGFPLADMSSIAVDSYESVRCLKACQSMKTLKADAIDAISNDAILCITKPQVIKEYAMSHASDGLLVIPAGVMGGAISEAFPNNMPKSMTAARQDAYVKLLTTYGYCPIVDAVSDAIGVTKKPKQTIDDDVIAFRIQVAYDENTGVQRAIMPGRGTLVGGAAAIDAAWCYGWFVTRCGGKVAMDDMPFSAMGIRSADATTAAHTAIVAYAYAMMGARKAEATRSYRPTKEMQEIGAGVMQVMMFTYVRRKHGAVIPQQAMDAMEDAYSRLQLDKSLVLYDYQAFDDARDASASYGTGSGVLFDSGILSHMMSDTNEIQDILSESLSDGDALPADDSIQRADGQHADGDDGVTDGDQPQGEATDAHETDAGTEPSDADDSMRHIADAIIKAFDGRDEMQVSVLQQAVIAASGDAGMTNARAMGMIAEANEWYESEHDETLVDIDGPLALLEV